MLTITGSLRAQSDILSSRLSLEVNQQSLEQVLKSIEQKTGAQFSFNAAEIETNRKISYSCDDNTLDKVLQDLFGLETAFKVRGKYIILQKRKIPKKKDFFVLGYVLDSETGERIENVSIYEPITLASALTNMHGYYKIKLPKSQKDIDLRFSKETYEQHIETIYNRIDFKKDINLNQIQKSLDVAVEPIKSQAIKTDTTIDAVSEKINTKISEVPVPETVEVSKEKITLPKIDLQDELAFLDSSIKNGKENFMNWLMTTKQKKHFENIRDSLYRPFQVSFLPFIGTNQRLSPITTNDISFNIIAGYTGNVNKLEIGTVANIIRNQMNGVQVSGSVNLVGRKMTGIQIAGASNFNLGNSEGVAIAGASNMTLKNSSGVQIAGAFNATLGEHEGLQIAPVNYAKVFTGTQIGVFNFAQEAHGVPIGFFSFVKKNGYRRLEIAASELNATELSFKTGTSAFYNIFEATYNYNRINKTLFGFGYGLGTSWKYTKWLSSNLDVVSTTYLPESFNADQIDTWSQQWQLNLGIEAKIGSRFAVFAAPTLNLFATQNQSLDFSKYKLLVAERQVNWFGNSANLYSWFGYKLGIRFTNKVS